MTHLLDGSDGLCSALDAMLAAGTVGTIDAALLDQCAARRATSATARTALAAEASTLAAAGRAGGPPCNDALYMTGCGGDGYGGSATCASALAMRDVTAWLHKRAALEFTCDASVDSGRLLRRHTDAESYACDALYDHDAPVAGTALDVVCGAIRQRAKEERSALAGYGRSQLCRESAAVAHVHGGGIGMGHTDSEEVCMCMCPAPVPVPVPAPAPMPVVVRAHVHVHAHGCTPTRSVSEGVSMRAEGSPARPCGRRSPLDLISISS